MPPPSYPHLHKRLRSPGGLLWDLAQVDPGAGVILGVTLRMGKTRSSIARFSSFYTPSLLARKRFQVLEIARGYFPDYCGCPMGIKYRGS